MQPRRVIFLMSDTGGGHRSAAHAIRAAMKLRYPGQYAFELIDVYRRYTPFPFTYMPEIYPRWVNWAGYSWKTCYQAANTHRRGDMVMALVKRIWGGGMRQMVAEHPGNVVVSVHSLFSRPVMAAFHQSQAYRPPFVSIITDLVSTHAFAYERDVDRCLVPTQAAYDRGRNLGLSPEQLCVTGLPLHPDFALNTTNKAQARRILGWDPTIPAVLLTGGGDGMGPLFHIARELNTRRLPMQLAIIAGRNQRLRNRLEAVAWHQPTHIYPFVANMPVLMAAADLLITKAGPATICEACTAGLPMVLSGAIPGQEDGNVAYVVENGAGVYAPGPVNVGQAVAAWLVREPEQLAVRSDCARQLARPNAVWEIADEIHQQAERGPVRTRFGLPHSSRQPRLRHTPEDGWVL